MNRHFAMLLLALPATRAIASPVLVAAYNETASPPIGTLWPYSTGWLWKSPINFQLTRIETKYAGGPDKTVGVEIYDKLPDLGGVLLSSATYAEVSGTWGGPDFPPISLEAGEDYFFGFTNVEHLFPNFTYDAGATGFGQDGLAHYDTDSDLPVSYVNTSLQSNVIIRIYGNVPEPSSLTLAALGVLAIMRPPAKLARRREAG